MIANDNRCGIFRCKLRLAVFRDKVPLCEGHAERIDNGAILTLRCKGLFTIPRSRRGSDAFDVLLKGEVG